MKYMLTIIEDREEKFYNITTTSDDVNFTSFPAEKGNPNYDAFLKETQLTDAKVKKLTPDVWYDFPEPLPVEPLEVV